jgi:hypothetical protein
MDYLGPKGGLDLTPAQSEALKNKFYEVQLEKYQKYKDSNATLLRVAPIQALLSHTYFFEKIYGEYL